MAGVEVEAPLPEIIIGASIINRDSEKSFQISGVKETKYGDIINLVGPDGEKATLGMDDLKTKLETDGSAWHW